MYLSLVVLCVEEVCVLGQAYHCSDIVLGLVDDGQVEQPIETERGGRRPVKIHSQIYKTKGVFSHQETSDTQAHDILKITYCCL